MKQGASQAEIDRALMAAFARRVPTNIAKNARDSLLDPVRRAWFELLFYNDQTLRRLAGNAGAASDAFGRANRGVLAAQWENRLRLEFPDPAIVHCLTVLWYWWTAFEERRTTEMVKAAVSDSKEPTASLDRHDLLQRIRAREGVQCQPGNVSECMRTACSWRDDCLSSAPPLAQMWEKLIACAAMLAATPDFWTRSFPLTESQQDSLRQRLTGNLKQTLSDMGQVYETMVCGSADGIGELGQREATALRAAGFNTVRDVVRAGVSQIMNVCNVPEADAQRLISKARQIQRSIYAIPDQYRSLTLVLQHEAEAAATMGQVGLRSTHGGVICCGPIMLRQVGLADKARGVVRAAVESQPTNKQMQRLHDMLSPFARIALLLRDGSPEEALEAIRQLPASEQRDAEVQGLRVRALHTLAKQRVSVGQVGAAIELWGQALSIGDGGTISIEIRKELLEAVFAAQAALQRTRLSDAIDLLGKAYAVVDDEKLRDTLAELLTRRSYQTFQKGRQRLDAVPSELETDSKAAQEAAKRDDWEAAIEHLRKAVARAEELDGADLEAECSAGARMCSEGLADIERAVELGYQRAKDQLEDARAAMKGLATDWRIALRSRLAAVLYSSSVSNANRAIELLNDERSAHEKRAEQMVALLTGHAGHVIPGSSTFLGGKCRLCRIYEATHTWSPPGKASVSLCGACAAKVKDALTPPSPSRKVVNLLSVAYQDVEEASHYDSGNDKIRTGIEHVRRLLSEIGEKTPPSRQPVGHAKASREARPTPARSPGRQVSAPPGGSSAATSQASASPVGQTRWATAFGLSLLLGYCGVDRFYLGRYGSGFLKLSLGLGGALLSALSWGPDGPPAWAGLVWSGAGIWWLIDVIMIGTNELRDSKGQRPVKGRQ